MRTLVLGFLFSLMLIPSLWAQIDVTTGNQITIGHSTSDKAKVDIKNTSEHSSLKLENLKTSPTNEVSYGIRNIVNNDSRANIQGYWSEIHQPEDATTNNYAKGMNIKMHFKGYSKENNLNTGILSDVTTYSTTSGFVTGVYTRLRGSGSMGRTGIQIENTNEGTGSRRGMKLVTSQSGSESLVRGIDNHVELHGPSYQNTARHATGFHNWTKLNNSSTGNKSGFYNYMEGDGSTGDRIAFYNRLTGGASTGVRYGIYNRVDGAGSNGVGDRYAVYNLLKSDNNDGDRHGLFNQVEVGNNNTGMHFGIKNNAGSKTSKGTIYGLHNYTTSADVEGYGIRNEIYGWNTGGTYYALYSTYPQGFPATSSGDNYAGFFNGAVVLTQGYTMTSDVNLKDNIRDMASQIGLVTQLRPVVYNYKSDAKDEDRYGFIAQEVQTVVPDVVKMIRQPGKSIYDTDGYTIVGEEPAQDILSMDYVELIPILTKAIQEQQAIIENLETRISELEN